MKTSKKLLKYLKDDEYYINYFPYMLSFKIPMDNIFFKNLN